MQNDKPKAANPKHEIRNPKQEKGRIQFLSSNDQNPKRNGFWRLDLEFRICLEIRIQDLCSDGISGRSYR
jgi:hypothetical protein